MILIEQLRKFGVSEDILFCPEDLLEKKNIPKVQHILVLYFTQQIAIVTFQIIFIFISFYFTKLAFLSKARKIFYKSREF